DGLSRALRRQAGCELERAIHHVACQPGQVETRAWAPQSEWQAIAAAERACSHVRRGHDMTRPKAGTSRAHARDAQLADLVRAIVRLVLSEDRDAPGTHAGELSDEDRFFAERCGFGAGCKADTSALRQAYEGWCKDQGVTPLSAREFAKRL